MTRIITKEAVFFISQRTDKKYALSVNNLLIAVKETYDEAFQVIFGGKTGVIGWDILKNKDDLFRVENEIVVSVEEVDVTLTTITSMENLQNLRRFLMRATNTVRWSLKVGQDLFTIFDIAGGKFNLCVNGLVLNTYSSPAEAALALWRGETGVKSWDDYLIGKEIPENLSAWIAETK